MASLSERLRRERELRGISLKQISEETRIGVRFLEALEADKLDIIPGEFYRRSYLRAYARYLGLDEDRALNAYDFSRKDKGQHEDAEPRAGSPSTTASAPKWLPWLAAALVVGAPVVLLLTSQPASRSEDPPASAPATPRPSQEDSASPRVSGDLSPFPPQPAGEEAELRLEVSVEESCWLEIEADGRIVVSGLKDQGFQQEVTARRELRLWLGNAGGVKLVVNDRPVRPLGRPGQVRRDLTITPDNYRDFVSPEDPS